MTPPAPGAPLRRGAEEAREALEGPRLLHGLHGVMRGMRLYDSVNQTLRGQLDELMVVIDGLMEDEVTLVGMGEHFYLNGVRLKAQNSEVNLYRSLMAELDLRTLGGLRFVRGLTVSELEAFLKLFLASRSAERGDRMPEQTLALGIRHVVPVRVRDMGVQAQGEEAEEEQGQEGERRRARQTFWRAVRGTQDLVQRASRTGRPALHLARRLVQPIVDSIMKNEYSIVGLTALKDHDEYTYAHCVNVSVLSIGIGQAVGLKRATLANMGVAALLHDLGKLAVPAEVLQKPGKLTPEEWTYIHRHPLEGVKMITRLPGLSNLTLDSMRVAFQHHMNVDLSGYPKVAGGGPQSTLSRVVEVADFFDAINSHRAYRKRAFTAFEALNIMLGPERAHFDPAALWALVRTVGLYPAGSVLWTASNHIVLSLSPNPRDLRRPHCRVLFRPDRSVPDPDQPEIWAPMAPEEQVLKVLPPEVLPVDTNTLLAA